MTMLVHAITIFEIAHCNPSKILNFTRLVIVLVFTFLSNSWNMPQCYWLYSPNPYWEVVMVL